MISRRGLRRFGYASALCGLVWLLGGSAWPAVGIVLAGLGLAAIWRAEL